MSSRRGICCKCFRVGVKLTDHHVFPNRLAKKKNNCGTKLYLCWDCHQEIDGMIPQYKKFTKEQCIEITKRWLRGLDTWVV